MEDDLKILVSGYGNPGRQDDGLAAILVERLEQWAGMEGLDHISFDINYQLSIEDAEQIAAYDVVVFVDASMEGIEDIFLSRVSGRNDLAFTTHAASPDFVVRICRDLFRKEPQAFLLHIKGFSWEFAEGLSEGASRNLERAFELMKKGLKNPRLFDEWALSPING